MAEYVDDATQTIIAGLTKHPSLNPPALYHDGTPTPPEDMPSKELHFPSESTPEISKINTDDRNTSPTLLLRRKNRPQLQARISLPPLDVDTETPRSPPPTEAVMSPLPAANKLHAGHTPIFPRSPLPLGAKDPSGQSTPEQELVLEGPLTLPAQPGDGAEDRIELKVLDAELEKIAQERVLKDAPEPTSTLGQDAEDGGSLSRKGSAESGRSHYSADEQVVDGVILKKPRMNMGAPLGQA